MIIAFTAARRRAPLVFGNIIWFGFAVEGSGGSVPVPTAIQHISRHARKPGHALGFE